MCQIQRAGTWRILWIFFQVVGRYFETTVHMQDFIVEATLQTFQTTQLLGCKMLTKRWRVFRSPHIGFCASNRSISKIGGLWPRWLLQTDEFKDEFQDFQDEIGNTTKWDGVLLMSSCYYSGEEAWTYIEFLSYAIIWVPLFIIHL